MSAIVSASKSTVRAARAGASATTTIAAISTTRGECRFMRRSVSEIDAAVCRPFCRPAGASLAGVEDHQRRLRRVAVVDDAQPGGLRFGPELFRRKSMFIVEKRARGMHRQQDVALFRPPVGTGDGGGEARQPNQRR